MHDSSQGWIKQLRASFRTAPIPQVIFILTLSGVEVLGYQRLLGLEDELSAVEGLLARLHFFRFYLLELILVLIAATWCPGRRRARQVGFAMALLLYLTIASAQYLSLSLSQDFLTRDAVLNIGHAHLLLGSGTLSTAAVPAFWMLCFVALGSMIEARGAAVGQRVMLTIMGLLAAAMLGCLGLVLPQAAAETSRRWADEAAVGSQPPGVAMLGLVSSLSAQDRPTKPLLDEQDLALAGEFGIHIDPSASLPFVKDTIYEDDLPFERSAAVESPSLLVLFVESLSARKLSIYGSRFQGITPRIEAFSQRSMVVDGYYNHTAATYRALQGQLCSFYPFHGGAGGWLDQGFEPPRTRLLGLPHLLSALGYRTIFMGAEAAQHARLDVLARSLGFDEVTLRDKLRQTFLGGESLLAPHLTDHQLMRCLLSRLERLDDSRPFFVAAYSLGTHANLDVTEDGAPYGDGSSNVLSATHSFDDAFGWFWQRFQGSRLARRTIVVITADHPHFPTQPFIEVAGPDYKRIFYDQIPLVIRSPCHELPRRLDARSSTSLSFAPTMAHLLGVPNQPNPFLGSSIFDQRLSRREIGFGTTGRTALFIDDHGRLRHFTRGDEVPSWMQRLWKIIDYGHAVELDDRLWDGREARAQESPRARGRNAVRSSGTVTELPREAVDSGSDPHRSATGSPRLGAAQAWARSHR